MIKIANLSDKERKELFQATAGKINLHEQVVEKDFWVCFLLDHLFNDSKYKGYFVFKGGTSLSKSYHLIKRFSEDIDLILDWRKIEYSKEEPWQERSRNKQDSFNKQMNAKAAEFYRSLFIPTLNRELSSKIKAVNPMQEDEFDPMVVQFKYPTVYAENDTGYIRSFVKLEIGPIAEWTPSHITRISPFVSEQYPALFTKKDTTVRTIDAERTFWEKITILHKISNFPEEKILPEHYARHLYDVYCMGHSPIKESAFNKKELLEKDVIFKQKFYYAKNAHYETATLADVKLVPKGKILKDLESDYKAMEEMIYGDKPDFSEIIQYLTELQDEIHSL